MERAILMKEWVKTRRVFFMVMLLAVAMTGYVILMMNRLIELKGVEHLWLIMLMKDNSFIDMIKYVPLVAGIAVGVAQMAPEASHKRLKLTLHLPYPHAALVLLMLAAGIMELLCVFAVQTVMLGVYDSCVLPSDLVARVLLTSVPWFMAGFSAYLFVAAICLEGTWHMRTVLTLLAVAVLAVYFQQPALEAYNFISPVMPVFVILLVILSLGSVIRFKEGRQD